MYGESGSPCLHPLCTIKDSERNPHCTTEAEISLLNTFIHCLIDSPKLKKKNLILYQYISTKSNQKLFRSI